MGFACWRSENKEGKCVACRVGLVLKHLWAVSMEDCATDINGTHISACTAFYATSYLYALRYLLGATLCRASACTLPFFRRSK